VLRKGILVCIVVNSVSLEFSNRVHDIKDETHLIVWVDLPGAG